MSIVSIVISKVPFLQQSCAGMAGFGSENCLPFEVALTHPCLGHLCELSKCTATVSPSVLGGSAEDIHQLEPLQACSCTELQRQLQLHWFSPGTGIPANFTEISQCVNGAVQAGPAQLCLEECLAFKTHSRQGPWQTASKDLSFDFSHL